MKRNELMYASIMIVLLLVSMVPMVSANELAVRSMRDDLDIDNGTGSDDNETESVAPYVVIEQVRINGDIAQDGDDLYVERGDEITLRVVLQANEEVREAFLGAFISGYRYAYYERDLVTDFTRTFNIPEGNKRSFDLKLKIPMDMEKKDAKVRLILFDENSASIVTYNYQLSIYGTDEQGAVRIRNFFVSPSDNVEAGRALSFKVQVKNYGNFNLDDVQVRVAIPELGIQTYETIDLLRKDETQSFESLLLRIPQDAAAKDYEVVATVLFDRFESARETQMITVTSSGLVTGDDSASVITMPESVQIVAGTQANQGSLYPILIENKGASSKTYVLNVAGHESWASAVFEPSAVVVVRGGQSQTVYLRLRADSSAEAGDHLLTVTVASGDDVKETSVLASVKVPETKDASKVTLKQVFEWALVALIIVLIVLGLIVVFKKMKKNDDEDDQTYY